MKKILITTMLVIAAISASAQTRQLFDFGWQFTHNGKTQAVDLPHDWDIFEGPNSGKGATGTGGGWFEAGKGEYRKQLIIDNGKWKINK
jgi:beta-galactosidase